MDSVKKATIAALFIAGLFSLWAIFVRAVEGPLDHPIGGIVLMYLATALLVGPVIGLLLPFAKHPAGAAVVGAVVGNVLYFVVFTWLDGGLDWMKSGSLGTLIAGFSAAGAVAGLLIYAFESRMEDHW